MSSISDTTLDKAELELQKLLNENDATTSSESSSNQIIHKKQKVVSNRNLIDFDPLNNAFNSQENWYFVFVFLFLALGSAGIIMNVWSWNMMNHQKGLLDKYEQSFENLNISNWALKCYKSTDADNPCSNSASPPSAKNLYNYQTRSNYKQSNNDDCNLNIPSESFPCLEVQNKIQIFPNFTNPNIMSFSDNNHIFTISSLVFPKTDVTSINQVLNVPTWQQSNIRTLPGTRIFMNQNAHLHVEQNNINAIQLPVVSWAINTFTNQNTTSQCSRIDYCQNMQIQDLVDDYLLFVLFNPYLSAKNGTVPTFSLCTCVQGIIPNVQPNPNLWNTMCIDGSSFSLTV